MSDATIRMATPSQTVGPFFHKGLPPQSSGGAAAAGERIRLQLRVTDGEGRPVDDAVLELWHSGPEFGRMPTREDGTCELEMARPESPRRRQAAHINVCLFARGLLRQLHTRIYFEDDPAAADDAVLALVPEDRRSTLFARRDPRDARRWLFDVRLQGPQETVFFDM